MGNDGVDERDAATADAAVDFITRLGCALIDAGAPTSTVGPGMQRLARRFELDCEITVLPNGVLAVNTGTGCSSLVTASRETLRFDQTEQLFAVLRAGAAGRLSAEAGLRELRRIVQIPPPVRAPWRFGGYCLMAVGLCLRQNPGVVEFIAALALSVPVAALLIGMPRLSGLKALMPAVIAFAVGSVAAVLVEHGQLVQPAQVVLPLLAMVLPGTLLAVGSFDTLRGALQAGTARLVGGVHQLLVLALGLVASQAAFALTAPIEQPAAMMRVGAWSPVVGLAIYVLGTCLAFCAPLSAWPSLAIVVYVGWAIQLSTDGLAGPYTSTFLAAAVAIVVATWIYPRFGPPPLLTLNALFRILGIGGLSLLQVTSLTVGNFIGAEVGSAAFTLISVALGLAAGMAVTERMRSRAENSSAVP